MSLSSGIRFNVGKSKAKVQMEPQTGVTFEDVAGCDGSKLELNEIVEFLKNPGKFSALGAKIPSGVRATFASVVSCYQQDSCARDTKFIDFCKL